MPHPTSEERTVNDMSIGQLHFLCGRIRSLTAESVKYTGSLQASAIPGLVDQAWNVACSLSGKEVGRYGDFTLAAGNSIVKWAIERR